MKSKKNESTGLKKIERLLKPYSLPILKIYLRSFCSRNGLTYGLVRTPQGKKD